MVSKPAMFNTFMRLQRDPDHGMVFVVRDRQRRARSILAAGAFPYWFADPATGPRYASDVIFVSTIPGAGLLLLRALEWWASKAGRVVSIDLEITSDIHPERTRGFYLDAGYRETGSQFVKAVP